MAIRPSGTEPKVKIYLEQFVASPQGNLKDLRDGSSELLDSLGAMAHRGSTVSVVMRGRLLAHGATLGSGQHDL